ncbi:formate dehydrogenase accessory sulfurtransferase FdhD [Aestuariivirga sp.]|uniref:formate dehydrogenase accessory sulfurtransferase FdhD n=1 Tax=Aestuariivirga sp. TaxID=2650926 RepID=UPI0039E68717
MTILPPSSRDPAPAGEAREADCSVTVTGTLDGAAVEWKLPEEVPVAIHFNSVPYAVMMATPADLEDFAIGFALSEGLIAHASHVANVLAFPSGDGFTADVAIPEDNFIRERMVSRSLEGRVGCGLCGIAEMADAIRMPGGKLPHRPLDPAAVARAFEALPRFQPMNAVNRTVHAAAWCASDGRILLAREDVGRHNALDKLIGAMARAGQSPDGGFVLMSSRCSFELVQKCALAGISALATVSAPTALAHRLAREAGLSLAALSKQGVMIFDGEMNGHP